MKNPFVFGQVVHGENYLKRPGVEKIIADCIADNQNLFVVGERRCGKTSTVLNVIISRLKKSYIHADFYGVRTEWDVVKKIIDAVATYHINNFGIEDALKTLTKFRLRIDTKPDGSGFEIRPYLKKNTLLEDLETVLKHIRALTKKRKLAVFFDEFQDIIRVPNSDSLFSRMRSIIQLIDKVSFIFAGSLRNKLDHIFRDPSQPFFKSAMPLDFPKIDEGSMFKFVSKKMSKKQIQFRKEAFSNLFHATTGITGDIQQFCRVGFDFLEEGAVLDETCFEAILCEVFKLEEKFYKYIMYESTLTKLQVDVLKTLATYEELGHQSEEFKEKVSNFNSNSINTAIKALEKQNIIYKEGRIIHFFNPYFKEWLKKSQTGATV